MVRLEAGATRRFKMEFERFLAHVGSAGNARLQTDGKNTTLSSLFVGGLKN
jgi:hypothetical protein